MKIDIAIPEGARQTVVEILNTLLADEYLLYTKTRNYHWNVTHCRRIMMPTVCQPLRMRPPNTERLPASSSVWNGCGSYSRAKATISSFVSVRGGDSRTCPGAKSSR